MKSLHLTFLTLVLSTTLLSPRIWFPRQVTISVDGHSFDFKTYHNRVSAVLSETGLKIAKEDMIGPKPHQRVDDGADISVQRALPVTVLADGGSLSFLTNAQTIAQTLEEAQVIATPQDAVLHDGKPSSPEKSLTAKLPPPRPAAAVSTRGEIPIASVPSRTDTPIVVELKRAVTLNIHDSGLPVELATTKGTLGESLAAAGIELNPGDLVYPDTRNRVTAGMQVYIKRSKAVTIQVDGQTKSVRTHSLTVGQVLDETQVTLSPLDRVEPASEAAIRNGMTIEVTRVAEESITNEEVIGYTTGYQPDPELEIDRQRVIQQGREGLRKWVTKIVYENGKEVERTKEREWIEAAPVNTVIGYGTKIILRQVESPDGPLTYWRKMRVYATSYNASHGGKSPDSPYYGITALGMPAQKGVIAVDPRVISFYTQMYVPGYGVGIAGDIGGAIKGKIIDLCYSEDEPEGSWSARWTDIYLLTPVPPPGEIRWMLPD